jgi:COP9 signalosome complex subunit 8
MKTICEYFSPCHNQVIVDDTSRCNAKYLWKRIPPSIKACTPELNNIWTVAQHMWKKDFPGIYKALNSVTWSDSVANIMKQVQGF